MLQVKKRQIFLFSEVLLQIVAVNWLKSTYLWQRCQVNPSHYQLQKDLTPLQLESKLKERLVNVLNELEKFGIIEMIDGFEVRSLELGRAMVIFFSVFNGI